MRHAARELRSHRRLLLSLLAGAAAAWAWPGSPGLLVRTLVGWDAFVWIYLVWAGLTIARADQGHLKQVAVAQAESAYAVLGFVIVGAVASFGAVFVELTAAKSGGGHAVLLPNVLFAVATVVGSWLLVPTLFTLSYASLFYGRDPRGGFLFPGEAAGFQPDYTEFLYFSFTIAVASQTSDIAVSTREMRRLVLLQSMLAFGFNTTILAFAINVGASLF